MKRNHRLRFAFQLCKDLGIDDPVAWFNVAPPGVIDSWLAYYSIVNDEMSGDTGKMTPDQALQHLSKTVPHA